MIQAAIFVIFPFCMVFAAVSDLLSMTIANRVSLLLVAGFAVLAPLTGMEWATYGGHFGIAAVTLAVTFGLFAAGAMGGGDAKLLTGIALWLGPSALFIAFLLHSALIGGALTLLILVYRRLPLAIALGNVAFLRRIADSTKGIPYGIALGMAGLIDFADSPLAQWALASLR